MSNRQRQPQKPSNFLQTSSETEDSESEILKILKRPKRTKSQGEGEVEQKQSHGSLQIKLKVSEPPQKMKMIKIEKEEELIVLPKDMDPDPVCPICLKIIIGDFDEVNEHIDECIKNTDLNEVISAKNNDTMHNTSDTTVHNNTHILDTVVVPGILSRTPSAYSLINVDEDDFNYGKSQYSEEDIERALKKAYLPHKAKETSDEQQEIKNSLLIKNILSSPMLNSDFHNLQLALRSLMDRLASAPKCAVCWEILKMPAVLSVNCWHVCCEECWLKTLGTKRLCPHCSSITNPTDLRKVFF